MSTFKPLLAAPVDFDKLDLTDMAASVKLDGIRAIVRDGVLVSRNLKPIRNRHVQQLFGRPEFEHLDGELILGDPTSKSCYLDTNSAVMSADGTPDVTFHVFDHVGAPATCYESRLALAGGVANGYSKITLVEQHPVRDLAHVEGLESQWLELGYEGLMLRKLRGAASHYKFGRSTAKEGTLLKLKRFDDAEAKIIGVEELMKNGNEATKNALGHTERSAHKENLIPMGTLGALICETPEGVVFKIGTGFDQKTRADLWARRDTLTTCWVKYKSFNIGVKDAPRFPVFLGLRDAIDL